MSRSELTKIYHNHLEFRFLYKENKLYVRDHIARKEYELVPTGQHDIPFIIQLNKYLDNEDR